LTRSGTENVAERSRRRASVWLKSSQVAFVCGIAATLSCCAIVRSAEPDGVAFFLSAIEPVLKQHCYECHSAQSTPIRGGLRVDARDGLLRGGDSGPAIDTDKIGDSLLLKAVRHESGLVMPPEKDRLPENILADLTRWAELGFPTPRTEPVLDNAPNSMNAGRQHWAFQPVSNPLPPTTSREDWGQTALDSFVLAKLEERGWQPSSAAHRVDLIRRATFDLTGLPPTPEAIDAFLNDPRPDAYQRLIDELLSSPQYGERWAQHWLDTIRFAETEGYEYDRHLPDAWRFRDFVIHSLNADKPFDQFVVEQLAGDELDPSNHEYQTASIFHRLGSVRRNAGNPEIALSRNEVLTERTDIIGAAFLGLTVACARCHNHKLEPISQKDYYRLQAYMAATDEHNIVLATPEQLQARDAIVNSLKAEIAALRAKSTATGGGQQTDVAEQIARLEEQQPTPFGTIPATWNDTEKRTQIHILRRGVWEKKGEQVGPRPLTVLVSDELAELAPDISNPRTQLAKWLVARDNPLTARVIVNRVWQQHFGVGLVKTANDFGLKGERPSHPELLDWLARTFIENGWQLNPLHRLIVLSAAYQQSGRDRAAASHETEDPENRLLWHFSRRRLSAEEVRDAMLCVSERFHPKLAGPSVIVPVEEELIQLLYHPRQWAVTKDAAEHDRRSIYLIAKRNLRLPFLENFDAPALQTSCARRESSTHAPQALEMLNGRLSNDLARAFAKRLEVESHGDSNIAIDRAFRLTFGRSPSADERTKSLEFLRDQPLAEFALALFNLNEFFYVR
jgi:hypothetical protein